MKLRTLASVGLCALALSCAVPARASVVDGVAATVPQFEQVATLIGPAPPAQQIHLVFFLPYPNHQSVDQFTAQVNNPASNSFGQFLTPDQFAAEFGPSQSTYSTVEYVATNAGMQVVQTYGNRKVIDVVATVAQADTLFNTVINQYSYNNVVYYANSVPALIPGALKGLIMAVSGFNNFVHKVGTPLVGNSNVPVGFGPPDIQTAYDEPVHVSKSYNGAGVTIAIETAYDYMDSDLSGYWAQYGVQRGQGAYVIRKIVSDPVNQGLPAPGQNDETTLDIEQASSNAPGANVIVYEGVDPLNSTFDDMYEQTTIDPRVQVITTSWGSCEAGADPNEVAADNDLFEQSAAEGQTRFAASGDNGSKDCGTNNPPDGLPGQPNPTNVDFPASSPWMGAAGGTTLALNSNRSIHSETAWSGSGGGISGFFSLPAFQSRVPTLFSNQWRNVPDVALCADPNTPYALLWNGSWLLSVGGTSAVAPNMAALYAQIDGYYGRRTGLAGTGLYNGFAHNKYPGQIWHDILSGSNGDYNAHSGYDNVTGVGSLNGYKYMLQVPHPRTGGGLMHARPHRF